MIQIVTATKGSFNTTLLHKSTNTIVDVSAFEHNTKPLPHVYNNAITKFKDNTDWIVFVHDDVIIEAPEALERQLDNLGDIYDVVGCAGVREVKLSSPALWHLMGDKAQQRGAVSHLLHDGKKYMTSFGPYPDRVILIDGVFMAVKTKVFETITFDETNPAGFHFYDLDFSMACHQAGFKVGVGDIIITHASPGLREFTQDWKNGDSWFLQKYRKLS
jgi:hypothetical protein